MKKRVKKGLVLFFGVFIFLIIGVGIVSAASNDITYTSTISIKWDGGKYISVDDANNNYVRASQTEVDDDKERFLLSGSRTGQVKSGDKITIGSVFNGHTLEAQPPWINILNGNDWIAAKDASYTSIVLIKKEGAQDGDVITCGDLVYFVAYDNGGYFWDVQTNKDNKIAADGSKNLFYIYGEKGDCSTVVTPPTDCIPKTCEELGKSCGTWSNRCGANITCGEICGPGEGGVSLCSDLLWKDDCIDSSKWNDDVLGEIGKNYLDPNVPADFCTGEPYSESIPNYPNCMLTLKCGCVWDKVDGCVGSVGAIYTATDSEGKGCEGLTPPDSSTPCTTDDNCTANQFCGFRSEVCIDKIYSCNAGQKQGDLNADEVIDYKDLDIIVGIVLYKKLNIRAGTTSTCCADINDDNSIDSDDTSILQSMIDDPSLNSGFCSDECIPKNCLGLGKECGYWDDGCGSYPKVSCGSCGFIAGRGNTYCEDGICTTTPSYCVKKHLGESCDDSDECCSNLCAYSPPYEDNVCLNYIPSDTCKGFGEECENGFECCSDRCVLSQSTGKSTCAAADIIATPVCKSLGRECNTGGECCSDVCIENVQKAAPPAPPTIIPEGSCALEGQFCGGFAAMPCCESDYGLDLNCVITSGATGICTSLSDGGSDGGGDGQPDISGACLEAGQTCYNPSTNALVGLCCGNTCDFISGKCIKTNVGIDERCDIYHLCNERQSLTCIQGTCQYVPKYCAECIHEGGVCSANDDKCCPNSGLMCISGECRQPTKRTDRYFTVEAAYNYDPETDAETISCGSPDLTIINPETTEIVDDEFQDQYTPNDFYATLIRNGNLLYSFKFNFPIFMYFDVEDNTEELGFPCYEGVGNVQMVISRGTDVFYTKDIDMASVCQLQPPSKSAEAGEEEQGGGIIDNIVTFFQNLFGLNG